MALQKPIISSVPAWDVIVGYTFTFSVTTGDQVIANTLNIYDNNTNTLIYTHSVTSFILSNTVPANAQGLMNGAYYYATITTQNAQGQSSTPSNPVQFYCYSTPTISPTNVPVGNIIENASYNFEFQYNQAQGELLNTYVVNLYDTSNIIISTSGARYIDSITSPPTDISYTFNGMSDNTVYGINVKGVTINNTVVSTEIIPFTVLYTQPNVFTILELTNNCSEGYITIKSNLTLIEGKSNPSPPIYIDNKEVNVTDNEHYVKWTDGYTINGDFTAKLWIRNCNENSTILQFTNETNQNIVLRYMIDYDDNTKCYVDLTVDDLYYIYSQSIAIPSSTETVCIQIRRINNVYELKFDNMGVII